ncbi:MAG: ribonuclease HII [Pseudomonadota bacterium]
MPDFSHEQRLGQSNKCRVVGIDEAGRGPWAGPVVAAALWLNPETTPTDLLSQLNDSKKLSALKREAIYTALTGHSWAVFGVGHASVAEIDCLNILQASLLAMSRAVTNLPFTPQKALVDGNKLPRLLCPAESVIKGDSASFSIAGASIIAKVTRDRIMSELAQDHPEYAWEKNQGYGTAHHQEAIKQVGITPHHRRSFRPIRDTLASQA